ncbi:unnamed protein product [Cyprideis torosa]|uniref:Ionotropic glutamate receptor L-glutamate and glycine-binding domain-containing protein n=1 Tax=Cyprideis torosa TaxID=163714 RepID=A0A7R8ZRX7_9CRUS|nr:unnamed protein product [Cyprideis torosa]CAG0904767.1 unnamed protein product [Cyprideis torosa]
MLFLLLFLAFCTADAVFVLKRDSRADFLRPHQIHQLQLILEKLEKQRSTSCHIVSTQALPNSRIFEKIKKTEQWTWLQWNLEGSGLPRKVFRKSQNHGLVIFISDDIPRLVQTFGEVNTNRFDIKFLIPAEPMKDDFLVDLYKDLNLYNAFVFDDVQSNEEEHLLRYLCLYCKTNKTEEDQHAENTFLWRGHHNFKDLPESFDGDGKGGILRATANQLGISFYLDTRSNKTSLKGSDYQFIAELAHHHNFSLNVKLTRDGWGVKAENSSDYNGSVGRLQRREIDLIGNVAIVDYERSEVIDYSSIRCDDVGYVMVVETPELTSRKERWQNILQMFTWESLVLFSVAIAVASVILYWILQWAFKPDDFRLKTHRGMAYCFIFVIKAFLGQSLSDSELPSYFHQRSSRLILLLVLLILSFFMSAFYKCTLFSFLSSPPKYSFLSSSSDLEASGRHWVTLANTVLTKTFENRPALDSRLIAISVEKAEEKHLQESLASCDTGLDDTEIEARQNFGTEAIETLSSIELKRYRSFQYAVRMLEEPGKYVILQTVSPLFTPVTWIRKKENIRRMEPLQEKYRWRQIWPFYISPVLVPQSAHIAFQKNSPLLLKMDSTIATLIECGIRDALAGYVTYSYS